MFKHLRSYFTVFTLLIVFSNSNYFWQGRTLLAVSIALQDSLRCLQPADLSDDSEHLTCVRHVSAASWFLGLCPKASFPSSGRKEKQALPSPTVPGICDHSGGYAPTKLLLLRVVQPRMHQDSNNIPFFS